jgi:hypothetical protein
LGLVGMAGLAITQPVLDLFGRNPEFFVAGRYGPGQIVMFALVVGLVPGLVAVVAATGARLVHRGLGTVVHSIVLAQLSFLFGLVIAGHLGVEVVWVTALLAAAVAGLVVWLERTRPSARTLLAYLAAGNLAFVALFLFASPTSELVTSRAEASAGDGLGEVSLPALRGPVVFVILDEFPATTIMRSDGTVNADRYPNLGRLAESSTWFRNASSPSSLTSKAVPSLLTGLRPDPAALPSHVDHPRSLFTLFGDRYPVSLYESVTDMCPPSVCDPPPQGSVGTALKDGVVVYGRQVLPGDLADDLHLPSIDHSWGSFDDDLGTGSAEAAGSTGSAGSAGSADTAGSTGSAESGGSAGSTGSAGSAVSGGPAEPPTEPATATTTTVTAAAAADGILGPNGYGRWQSRSPDERRPHGQLAVLREFVSQIRPEPSVNFVHVVLPHYPWTLTPWGTRLTQVPAKLQDMEGLEAQEFNVQLRYQLHSLQVGAVDLAIGEMIDHLESVGAWEEALVVVTSDHGTGLRLPDVGRVASESNREERLRMPLFIKAPGQGPGEGEVRDEVASTLDILPSLVDVLGGSTDWQFDGHSLYDGSSPRQEPQVDESLQPALDIAVDHADDFGGDGWDGLAALGIARDTDLVGREVASLAVGGPSALAWRATDENLFDALPTADGRVPHLVVGHVTPPGGVAGSDRPPQLLLAVNGTIAGVAATHQRAGNGWQVMGMVSDHFEAGPNTVEAFELELTPAGPVLHPLGDTSSLG